MIQGSYYLANANSFPYPEKIRLAGCTRTGKGDATLEAMLNRLCGCKRLFGPVLPEKSLDPGKFGHIRCDQHHILAYCLSRKQQVVRSNRLSG